MNSLLARRMRHALLITGVLLIIIPALLFVAAVTGVLQLPEILIAGESPEHSVARIAIVGCLLAAIGTLE